MYKRIYDKTKIKISKLENAISELERKKDINEKQSDKLSFSKCKKTALDYMSLNNPTKEQILRLVKRIEIDKNRRIYVYLKFPELLV